MYDGRILEPNAHHAGEHGTGANRTDFRVVRIDKYHRVAGRGETATVPNDSIEVAPSVQNTRISSQTFQMR